MSLNLSRESLANSATGELLFVGFNQDNSCFAVGTTNGFVIYHVDPLRETFRRTFSNGGIGIVEMLYRCNLLAIVGGGRNPRYPINKVMIWDDFQNKCIGELMFKSEVHAVRLRRDRVVVVLLNKVYVYRFKDLKLVDQIQTINNSKGLVALCCDPANNVLAVPGLTKGSIRVELYNISKATILKAHDTDLAQFALTFDGSKIASASEKGTLIRIWDCVSGELLRELRRGMDRAEIYCIAFNFNGTRLACSSDKGTVHIFSFANDNKAGGAITNGAVPSAEDVSRGSAPSNNNNNTNNTNNNATNANNATNSGRSQSIALESEDISGNANNSAGNTAAANNAASGNKSLNLGFLRGVLPASFVPKYFDSEWSYAQIHGVEGRALVAFSRDPNKIFVVSSEGTFLSCSCADTGECARLATVKFMQQVPGASGATGASESNGLIDNANSTANSLSQDK